MSVRFKVTTMNGDEIVGAIQGCGGYLGGGTMHVGYEKAAQAAERQLQRAKERALARLDTGLFEPRPGYVAIYSVEGRPPPVEGQLRVDVPLTETAFEVLSQ